MKYSEKNVYVTQKHMSLLLSYYFGKKKYMLGGCIFLSTGRLAGKSKGDFGPCTDIVFFMSQDKRSIQMQVFLSLLGHFRKIGTVHLENF